MPDPVDHCLTPRELARRWRTSPGKVRAMIRAGKIAAISLDGGHPKVTPEAIAAAESGVLAIKPRRQKRREPIPPHVLAMLE